MQNIIKAIDRKGRKKIESNVKKEKSETDLESKVKADKKNRDYFVQHTQEAGGRDQKRA